MNEQDGGKRLLIVGGAVVLGIAVLNGIYRAGVEAGLRYSGQGDIARWHDYDGGGGGLFPLLLIGGIVFFVGTRKGWWGNGHSKRGGPGGPGGPGWGGGRRPGGGAPHFVEEWHRRAHEAERQLTVRQPAVRQPAVRQSAVDFAYAPKTAASVTPTPPATPPATPAAPAPAAPATPAAPASSAAAAPETSPAATAETPGEGDQTGTA